MEILIIDNYDSFTFNLIEKLREFKGLNLSILKNDDTDLLQERFDAVIISPGPGLPHESGRLLEAISFYALRQKPILGICLGLQAIGVHFGGQLKQLDEVRHGIRDLVVLDQDSMLFQNIRKFIHIGRYHSWVLDSASVPTTLKVVAKDKDETIMAIEHLELPIFAVQFHPESYMTEFGDIMMQNFIDKARENWEELNRENLILSAI